MKKLVVFLLLVSYAGVFFAQNSPIFIPADFITPTSIVNVNGIKEKISGKPWIVYSDRSQNSSFEKPGSSKKIKDLNFLDHFFVIEETDGWIKIISDPNFDWTTSKFSQQKQDYGWVKKDEMLLWNHCLIDSKSTFDKKAMLLNTVETVKMKTKGLEFDKVKFSQDPEGKTTSIKQSSLYEILFVFKKENGLLLLGDRPTTLYEDIKKNVYGWVPENRVTPWDTRVVIEPNWKPEAIAERKRKGQTAKIFLNISRAENCNAGNCNDNYLWQEDSYNGRMPGSWRRFPVLRETEKNGIYEVGVMGKVINDIGNERSALEIARIDSMITNIKSEAQKINIVFVVDGSTSMYQFFKPISQAIDSTMDRLIQGKTTNNEFRFGAVVYRDYLEGDRLAEVHPLTSDEAEVSAFFRNIESYDSKDKDYPEAVFYGLKTALNGVLESKYQSNFIILIGDAGNHHRNKLSSEDETVIESSEISNLLNENRCNLIAFQVNQKNHPTYPDFVNQVKNLLTETAQKRFNLYEKVAIESNLAIKPPQLLPVATFTYQLNETAMIGKLVYCDTSFSLSPTTLRKEISISISQIDKHTSNLLTALKELSTGNISFSNIVTPSASGLYESVSTSYGPGILELLKESGLSYSDISFISKNKLQMYSKGFTTIDVKGLANPLFSFSLMMKIQDLVELCNSFEKLIEGRTTFERRQNMFNAWWELLSKYQGKVEREEFVKSTFDELQKKLTGLAVKSPLLKDLTPDMIMNSSNPKYLKDADFERIVGQIDGARNKLDINYISKNGANNQYWFETFNDTYYWVDHEILP